MTRARLEDSSLLRRSNADFASVVFIPRVRGLAAQFKGDWLRMWLLVWLLLHPAGEAVAAFQGTMVAWGGNDDGQSTVPTNLNGVAAIAAGFFHNLALKEDGTVMAWGWNANNQSAVPVNLSGVIALAAGDYHTLALKGNVTVVAWGANNYGQTTIPANVIGVVALAGG